MTSPSKSFFAHSANEKGDWHLLQQYLVGTAERAASFGRNSLESNLFRYAGLLHDVGKYQDAFQAYLIQGGRRGSVPHAALGAAIRYQQSRQNAVSLAILGHHQGLLDFGKVGSALKKVAEETVIAELQDRVSAAIPELVELESYLNASQCYNGKDLRAELFTRYLFSSLTDADWLDTESHYSPEAASTRSTASLQIDDLILKFEKHFSNLPSAGEINHLRNEVRKEAVSSSNRPAGFFSLNVPTGLGKTLTSTYWALMHARANALRRVIIVLPYVNIIEQTARVISEIVGADTLLEHHSGVLEDCGDGDTHNEERGYDAKKLATENWDYPLIVTTTVQFFESLFSNKPSKCRKVHNIASSVVIFDEVQALPQQLVQPTLEMLKQVHEVMGTRVMLQ